MKEIIVILDNIRSALNVGAIFRTCEGAGVAKLILTGITPYPPHPKIRKTALGAESMIEFEYSKDIFATIDHLKEAGFQIISVEESPESKSFFDFDFGEKVVLIYGHEITGINPDVQKVSDEILELPMLGNKRSLNVATTVGITVYNAKFSK